MAFEQEKEELKEQLFAFLNRGPRRGYPVKVLRVNDNYTIDAIDDSELELYNIRLRASVNDNQSVSVAIPAVGSYVMIEPIDGNEHKFRVSMVSEITRVEFLKGENIGMYIDLEAGDIVMNGGENGGLTIVSEILAKINRLEDKLKAHQHGYVAYPGGAATPGKTSAASLLVPPLTDNTLVFNNTTRNEIENNKVKH